VEASNVERVEVGVARLPGNDDLPLPEYMSDGASGMDLPAAVGRPVTIPPGGVVHVPTGIAIEVPPGHEGQVRSRSGLALRHGVFVLNGPGTVDSDYRGEVGVVLANFGSEAFTVRRGDRIAQLVIGSVSRATWVEREVLEPSARQGGGFGHTGGHGEPGP
jgi:dUTP pyrophosphatase